MLSNLNDRFTADSRSCRRHIVPRFLQECCHVRLILLVRYLRHIESLLASGDPLVLHRSASRVKSLAHAATLRSVVHMPSWF